MIELDFDPGQTLGTLKQIESDLQGKAIRAALTPAVKPIRDAMKSIIEQELFDQGNLHSSIGRTAISKRAKGRLGIPVDTVAIIIGPKKSKIKSSAGNKNRRISQYGKAVIHEFGQPERNIPATRFMERALMIGELGIQGRFYKGLQTYINKITKQ